MISVLCGVLFFAAAYGIYRFAKSRGLFSADPVETPTRPGTGGSGAKPK